jgi:prepilin-type N-terminal cleavage/methylation domain-containing protein
LPKLKLMHKEQRGFTLIEMLVVVTLIGLISTGITASIIQVLDINTRASNHMVALRQVQQAGKEVSKDTLQARPDKILDTTLGGGALLALNWTDWESQEHLVVYTVTEDGKLQRTYTIDGEAQATAPPVIAEYIDPDITKTFCDWDGDVLTFQVTATVGGQSETRVYEIEPRTNA